MSTCPGPNWPKQIEKNLPVRSKVSIDDVALNKARNSRSYYSFDEATSKEALNQLYRYKVEWHKKMSLPVSITVFLLIGAPLGAIIRKGGSATLVVVVSVGFFVIYYIITITGEKMAREGSLGTCFWACGSQRSFCFRSRYT